MIELDHEHDTVRVDWHRYAPDQVETWVDQVLEAAYRHGYRQVEFVHGAVDVAARGTPGYTGQVRGRGQIKELLRRRLYRGQWRRWAKGVREGEHDLREGRMVIALLENPVPDPRARWPVLPPPAYPDGDS